MIFARPAAAAILFLVGFAPAAGAQSGDMAAPSELPPASYAGAEFVDSRGCVFMRAGIDGDVRWVPRLDADREPVCGQPPSVIAGASVAPPPAPAVEEIALDAEATSSGDAAVTAETGSAPRARIVPKRRAAALSKPARRRSFASGGAAADTVPATVTVRRLGKPVPSTAYPGHTRVVPLHVAQMRARAGTFAIPRGYNLAWEDDRLNPRRAEGTLAGRDAMNTIWTTTVPRRLIDTSRAKNRSPKPAVVYPYVDEERIVTGRVTLATREDRVVTRAADRYGSGVGR